MEEQANPFHAKSVTIIIFQGHNAGKKGISYNYYTNFVKFLFLGCRPSEQSDYVGSILAMTALKSHSLRLLLGLAGNPITRDN